MNRKNALIFMSIVCCILILTACGPNKAELEAQEAIVRTQKAFDIAKEAYTELCNAADLTISVMDSVYGAWYFGIYKAGDSTTSSVISDLAKETSLY